MISPDISVASRPPLAFSSYVKLIIQELESGTPINRRIAVVATARAARMTRAGGRLTE
jgi:hypothetical protein